MRIFLTDLQYAWHRARRQPGVTLSIILLLALGMGGVTAVFNPLYSTLFSPLPFPQPEQLVRIVGNIPLFRTNTSSFEHEEILERIFSSTTAYSQYKAKIRIPDTGKHLEVNALRVSEGFFETLGVKPLIGNLDGYEGRSGFIVSHRFWRNALAQNPDAVGSHIFPLSDGSPLPDLNPLPVVGIMPEGFNFPFDTDIWLWKRSGSLFADMNNRETINFVGRLRAGVPFGLAAEELRSIKAGPSTSAMGTVTFFSDTGFSGDGAILQSLQTFLYGDQRPMLRMLGAAAILFLALVCAGVINLLIAQGARRKQEIATRLIHGATRRNVVFQLLRETLPLVVIGGLAGWWLSEIAGALMWAQMPALRSGAVAVPVKIAFWSALVMVVTFIGGLIPALYATGLDLNTYLKAADGSGRRFFSTQEFLVGLQLSLALALLIGVGVLIRSMMFNVDIPIGWSSRDIAVVSVTHPFDISLSALARVPVINDDIRNELSAMPEVMATGMFAHIPFTAAAIRTGSAGAPVYKTMPSQSMTMGDEDLRPVTASVSPGGFDMLGVPLVLGRDFTDADVANLLGRILSSGIDRSTVTIINQAFAERMWPGENPIGNVFYDRSKNSYEVVGVVRNFHHIPGTRDFIPARYIPYANTVGDHEFLVKLRPFTSFQDFHSNMRQHLSDFPLEWVGAKPLSEHVKEATAGRRLTLQLLAVFAVLGIIVSGLAVYATAALAAASRTREIGIRMAMGATTWDILELAFRRGIRSIILGLPFGLFMAWILAKALAGFLVQVDIGDPFAWIISCVILLVIATAATLIPALRASHVNPLDALRG